MAKTRKQTVHRPDPDDISTSGMATVTVQCLLLGIDLGWTATEMRNGVIRLTRDHEGRAVAINLPTNQRSIKESVGQSWIRKVIRYADPLKRAMLQAAVEDYDSPIAGDKERARIIMSGLRSHEVLLDHSALGRIIQTEETPPLEVVAEPEPEPEVQQEQEQPATEAEIVKVKPWIARHSMRREGGEVYESKAVLERKWSDGSTDYACPRCEFTNVEPRKVAAHYGGKHGQEHPTGKEAQAQGYIDPAVRWTPTERQRGRIHRLASEMKQALEALGPEMTVDQCAEWIVKHRDDQREHMVDESTPLTPEQAIERIRRLVDGGAYADLMARIEAVETEAAAVKAQADVDRQHERLGAQNAIRALEQRLTEQQEACQDANERVAAAEQDAREAHERWTALRDIVNG